MIETILVSGFLGAGKTTLIKKLLNNPKLNKMMLLENEFGEVGIDGKLFGELQVTEINAGCICCSLEGKLDEALDDIAKYDINTLIVEPSGVAKLSEIKKAFVEHESFKLISYTTVIDCSKFEIYHNNFGEFYDDQIVNANVIYLSHTDEVEEDIINDVIHHVSEMNPKAMIISSNLDSMNDEFLLDTMVSNVAIINEELEHIKHEHHHDHEHEHHHHDHEEECCCHDHKHHHHHDDDEECHREEHHHHDHDEECCCHDHEHHHHHHEDGECCCGHHHDHDADEVFNTFGFKTDRAYTKEELLSILNSLDKNVIRAKGIVKSNGTWLHFEYVLNSPKIEEYPDNHVGLISVIGCNLDEHEIEELFLIHA